MDERMENAFELAYKCWEKAFKTHPEFVESYLTIAHQLLKERYAVTGDIFRSACREQKVFRPKDLHPNVWVSGVKVLKSIGWIEAVDKVTPTEMHNHMPTVTLWRSKLF